VHTTRRRSLLCVLLVFGALAVDASGAAAQGERVFELVSPASKNNVSILDGMAIDSDHASLLSTGSILGSDPFSQGAGEYVASRLPTAGWTLEFSPLARTSSLVGFPGWNDRIYESFSPLLPGEPDDFANDVYRRTAGELSLVSTGAVGGQGAFDAGYLASADGGSHILFRTAEVLDARDSGRDPSASMLYERVGDQTRAVGLDSDGQPIGSGGAILAGSGAGAMSPLGEGGTTHPISTDGTRVFFEAPDPAQADTVQLYVREHGQTTTQVSASQRTTPGNGSFPARFEGAAADGSRVLFRTAAQLVDDDVDGYIDLYAYDLAGQRLTLVSAGQQGPEIGACQADAVDQPAGVCGVVAVSEDAQRVYYLSTGALAAEGIAGQYNVYLYDGWTGVTQTVLSAPSDVAGVFDEQVRVLYQGGFDRATAPAETSADGSVLVFAANSPLTGYDNQSPACADAVESRCAQIYRYDADAYAGDLSCLSCPLGREPLGAARVPVGGRLPGPARRFLAPDGSAAAFESPDSLVPADANGRSDVYEARVGGVSLVTDGASPRGAKLIGIGPDGVDLLFLTGAVLVPQDTDSLTDLYDARIGGGLPGPPAPREACAEAACQGLPSVPPAVTQITSDAARPGNVVPEPRPRIRLVRLTPVGSGVRATVRVSAPGKVSLAAKASVTGRSRMVAKASKRLGRATTTSLVLEMSRAARRELRQKGRLKLVVTAHLSRATRWARDAITVRVGRRR
jgi:hypothetical protein